jgi:hypothetical protein
MNDVRKISAIAQILSICAVALSPNFPAGAAMLACAADDLKVKIRVKCDTCMIGTVIRAEHDEADASIPSLG